MKIPHKVKVGAMSYSIKYVANMFSQRSHYGTVAYGDNRIEIAGDISNQRQLQSYIHGLTKAILFEMGSEDLCNDEEFVRRLSNMLTQVIVDNEWKITKGEER